MLLMCIPNEGPTIWKEINMCKIMTSLFYSNDITSMALDCRLGVVWIKPLNIYTTFYIVSFYLL